MAEQTRFDPERFKRDQREVWSAAAQGWRKWWSTFEAAAQHVSDRLIELAEVGPGQRVLDVATGIGEPAVTAARRVGPSGWVMGIDQAPGMLKIARERAASAGLSNLEFREQDIESLELQAGGFDAVLCRWGLMFMTDLDRALAGLFRRITQGGRLATAVWAAADKVPLISVGAQEVRRLAGLPPPVPGTPDPLRLADVSILTGALKRAGFRDVTVEPVAVTFEFESAQAVVDFRRDVSSQFRTMLLSRPPELREKIEQAVREAARTHMGGGKVRFVNESICFAARR